MKLIFIDFSRYSCIMDIPRGMVVTSFCAFNSFSALSCIRCASSSFGYKRFSNETDANGWLLVGEAPKIAIIRKQTLQGGPK